MSCDGIGSIDWNCSVAKVPIVGDNYASSRRGRGRIKSHRLVRNWITRRVDEHGIRIVSDPYNAGGRVNVSVVVRYLQDYCVISFRCVGVDYDGYCYCCDISVTEIPLVGCYDSVGIKTFGSVESHCFINDWKIRGISENCNRSFVDSHNFGGYVAEFLVVGDDQHYCVISTPNIDVGCHWVGLIYLWRAVAKVPKITGNIAVGIITSRSIKSHSVSDEEGIR